jgi:hypothetical protein
VLTNLIHPYATARRRAVQRSRGRRLLFESLETRQLLAGDLAARFEFANASGNVVSSLSVGQDFELRLYVQDIRAVPTGIFQAYFDVSYPASLTTPIGNIVHGAKFSFAGSTSGTAATPGLIDEVGGINTDQYVPPSQVGREEQLFSVPMRAVAAGTLNLTLDLADQPNRIVAFFSPVTAVQLNKIDVTGSSIVIGSGTSAPSLAIAAADAVRLEGNSGLTPFTFTVTRNGPTTGSTHVNWAVTGSGANPANAADFGGTLPSGTLSFAAGETSRTITVNVTGDTLVEPDEGFTVTLSGASGGATITTATANGTIRNDDPALSIAALDANKLEGNSGATPFTFTVTRSGYAGSTTTVNWSVTGSGANPANAADFGGTLPSGTLSFAAGETSRTITVNVTGDTLVEPDEGFTVTLSGASGGATITTATANGTIRNDDSALSIAALDANKLEGNSGATPFTFRVTRSGYTGGATTVNWSVTGSGASPANAADFGGTLPSGTLGFAAGETSKTITVNVTGDTLVEPDEGFTVTLSGASSGTTITTPTANGTIRNDDPALSIAALDASKFEGNSGTTPFTFRVTRSGYTGGTTTVNWAVTGSGANPANAADFGGTLPSGTLGFAAGETSKTIIVNITGDTLIEPDEGFTVTLSGASGGATITTAAANGTIRNDDPALSIAALDANKFEGNSGTTPFTFRVTRSGYTGGTTTVNWAVIGSGANPANAADFGGSLPGGTLNFAAGETGKTITVNVTGDTLVEPDEGFTVTLSGASGAATITTAAANGTIRNDDPALSIAALDASKFEGNSGTTPFTFRVTRSGYTGGTTTVNWSVTGSGASPANAADFGGTLPSGTLSFAAGETSKTITVSVTSDTLVEPDEGFTVTLSGASGGTTITTAAANGTIRNDDPALSIAALDASKFEGNSGITPFTFRVTRSGYTGGTTTVNWSVTGSGASPANAADFGGTLPSGTLGFAAGETSKTITVNVTGDTLVEPDEGFTVTLSGASGAATITTATANGTIRNDDSATFGVSGVTPMDSGFMVDFNSDFKAELLNLYDNATGALGPADITVVGAAGGSVRGSVVVRADKQQFTFIKTDGPLEPDAYTITLRSAADGFVDSDGNLLDGDGDGVAGGNFVSSFVVGSRPANEVTLSVPDFARGFGQAVNLPSETSAGIPVMLSTGQNVTAVDLDLVFDPALLDVTSFSHSVAGASSSFHLVAPGRMRITVSSANQFRATPGTIELGRFIASVPAAAPYAAKQILRLENARVEDTVPQPRPVRTDHGLHLAAFVGDGNASRTYTGGDATLLQRLIVGQGSGLSAYPLADPMLIADVNRSDTLTGGDATLLQRMIVGTPINQAPAPPSGIAPPPIVGPDPRLFIPTDLTGKPGDTVTVPVMLEVTEAEGISVAAVDLALAYDPSIFTASNFVRGAMLDGFGFSAPTVNTDTPGILRVTMSTASGPELAFGAIGVVFRFDVAIRSDVPEGSSRINLLQSFESTFTGLENNEIEPLTLIPAPTNADNDAVDGVFTITSPAARLSITATDADRPEGNSGFTPLLFTVTRSGLTTETTTVNFAVTGSGPNPADAADFGGNLPSGQITFEPGETEKALTVNVSGDVQVEPDEGFTVTLLDASENTQIIDASASGTIRNDDTQVSVSVAPTSVVEDDGQALVYTFVRIGVISEPLSVSFLVDGMASFGVDYTQAGADSFSATAGSVTFAAGTSTAAVTIVPIADDLVEDDETVVLSLVPGDRYTVGVPDEAVGTIVDDDRPCVFIEDAAPILEGDEASRPLVFFVRLCRPMEMPLSIDYATRDGSATAADGDYQPVSGTLIFRPGEALVQTVEVLVFGDRRVEPDEDLFLDLSNLVTADPDAAVTRSTARGIILNDDTTVAIQVAPESVLEDGSQPLIFTFSREGVTESELTVDFQVDGTATFEVDYAVSGAASFTGNTGTVTFPAGASTVTVVAQPIADQIVEEDETIVLTLVPTAEYTAAAPATATGTILNDDTDVWITVSPNAISEDSGLELTFTFTRSGVVDQPLTVQFSVGGDALFNQDYLVDSAASFSGAAGSVQFAAGQTITTVAVRPVPDDQVEPDETVVLTLLPSADYEPVDPASATGTILNDDTGLSIRATDAVRREGDSGTTPFTFTVERTGLTDGEITVDYSVSGSGVHPADAEDFGGTLPSGQVTFAPGETLQTITVLVTGDTEVEPHEGFTITLSNASAGSPLSSKHRPKGRS